MDGWVGFNTGNCFISFDALYFSQMTLLLYQNLCRQCHSCTEWNKLVTSATGQEDDDKNIFVQRTKLFISIEKDPVSECCLHKKLFTQFFTTSGGHVGHHQLFRYMAPIWHML